MNIGCDRCKSDDFISDTTQLLGGYNTRICNGCKNTWYELMHDDPLFLEGKILHMEMEIVKRQNGGYGKDVCGTLVEDMMLLENRLFHVGKAFVEDYHSGG